MFNFTDLLNWSSEDSKDPSLSIDAVVVSRSDRALSIFWMGQRFKVRTSDVLAIRESPIPLPNRGSGLSVRLILSSEAKLSVTKSVRPADVLAALPFALHRPSEAILIDESENDVERRWFEARGIVVDRDPTASATTQYTPSQSSQVTPTKTTTDMADSKVDDTPSDGMGTDDQDPDGVSNDDADDDDDDDDG